MDRRARISQLIEEFDAQGHHRTGTGVDDQSGRWLRDILAHSCVNAGLETHEFARLQPEAAFVEVEGLRIEGQPRFDSTSTGAEGVRGRLGLLGADADIGLAVAPPYGHAPQLEAARGSGAHRALICVTQGGRPGLAPRNASSFLKPFGVPLLEVSSTAHDALDRAAKGGASATVVSTFTMVPATASNVVASLRGIEPGLRPVVVMTPRSGWWHCASERGGGIACLAELAREFAERPLRRTVLFVASTAHELGYWGIERYITARSGLANEALLWLHFGASIGAALSPRPSLLASEPALIEATRKELERAGAPPVAVAPQGTVPGGESKNIHERGGRYVSFAGGSEVFHLEADRWPEAVDVAAVEAYAVASIALLRALDSSSEQ